LTQDDWEVRLAALWKRVDAISPEEFVAAIDALAADLIARASASRPRSG
jgi:hypothetical protein